MSTCVLPRVGYVGPRVLGVAPCVRVVYMEGILWDLLCYYAAVQHTPTTMTPKCTTMLFKVLLVPVL